jgi:polyphosphate kinase 2 (PPK2 family)
METKPMDLESFRYEFSRARDQMLEATDSKHAPWYVVRSDDKKNAAELYYAFIEHDPLW